MTKKDPNNTLVRYFAGNWALETSAYERLSEWEMKRTEEHIEKLLESEPNHPATLRLNVVNLSQRGKFREVIAYLEPKMERGVRFEPTVLRLLVTAYFWANKFEKGMAVFQQWAKLFPTRKKGVLASVFSELILQALLKGNVRQAKVFYRKAKECDSDFSENSYYREKVIVPLFEPVLNGHSGEEDLERAWWSLDLIYADTPNLSARLKEVLKNGYKQLQKEYEKTPNPERMKLIIGRLSTL